MQRWSETIAGGSGSLVMAEMASEKVQVYWYGWSFIAIAALLTVALAAGWHRYSTASGTLHRLAWTDPRARWAGNLIRRGCSYPLGGHRGCAVGTWRDGSF